jgi:hypothetical protein
MFFLPAVLSLVFAWSVWIANKRPVIAEWRLATFRLGLVFASAAVVLLVTSCVQMLRTLQPAQGPFLVANWLASLLWGLGASASLFGKGAGRTALFSWGLLMIIGALGASSAMIP